MIRSIQQVTGRTGPQGFFFQFSVFYAYFKLYFRGRRLVVSLTPSFASFQISAVNIVCAIFFSSFSCVFKAFRTFQHHGRWSGRLWVLLELRVEHEAAAEHGKLGFYNGNVGSPKCCSTFTHFSDSAEPGLLHRHRMHRPWVQLHRLFMCK